MRKAIKFDDFFEVVVLFWTHATPFVRKRLFTVMALLAFASALTALAPVLLKWVVDRLTGDSSGPSVSIYLLIGAYVLSQFSSRVISEFRGFIYARAERRVFRALMEQFFSHVMHLPLPFHLNRQTGAIAQTLDSGLQGYQIVLHHLCFTVLPIAVELGAVIAVLTSFGHGVFIALFCVAIICCTVAFGLFAIRIHRAARSASSAQVASMGAVTDAILNYETVKLFAAEQVMQEHLSQAFTRTETEFVAFFRRSAHNGLGVAITFSTFLAAAVFYATYEVRQGQMTVGDFVLVNTYMLQAIRPLEMLGNAAQGLSHGMAMIRMMLDVFHEKTEPSVHTNDAPLTGPGALEFDQVHFSYQENRQVLKNISFKVPAGKTLGIVGASGAGKSTIVRLLVRLTEPDSGEILLDGASTRDLSLTQLRHAIAVVPQDTVLFNNTIAHNIAFGKFGATEAEVQAAARLAHLHEFVTSLPEGYETKVGERGLRLSGGERQRVSIARAALKRPSIYVFDEATSSLDSQTEQDILANLREISRSSTTLIIAHRLSTVVHADEIVVLAEGSIVERGTHAQLLQLQGAYAALWCAQQRGGRPTLYGEACSDAQSAVRQGGVQGYS